MTATDAATTEDLVGGLHGGLRRSATGDVRLQRDPEPPVEASKYADLTGGSMNTEKNWEILLNGQPYSHFYTSEPTTPETVLARWKRHTESLGYAVPDGVTVREYLATALDRYGVGRGG
jgi:hypothetical protein